MEENIFTQSTEDINDITIEENFGTLHISEINLLFTNNFLINPKLWVDIDEINKYITRFDKEIKYVRDDLSDYSNDLNHLPTDKGGIYFFFIKPPLNLTDIQYLVYIGRAKYTKNQNLKKRCREYFYDFQNVHKDDSRTLKIKKMITRWGKYLYLKYVEFDDNELIDSLETLLINNIRPPFNDFIPNKKFYTLQNAF